MQFRDLHAQYESLKNDIDSVILDVVQSGIFISGPQVGQLEQDLADCVGVKHCISCANGTDALQLALMAWGIGPGDAVFVPDFTFFSSGEVVSAVGATPVFIDVESSTFNLDPEKLVKGIQWVKERTELVPRVVIAVDLFGLPANYSRIKEICSTFELLLLEDGAQGFGGEIFEKRSCSFGDISTTSFFPAKPLGCYGDGGAVFTDDDNWAKLIKSFAVHGKGSMKYDNVRVGMNSRLDTIQAAVLQIKLEAFFAYEVNSVRQVAEWYTEGLRETPFVLPASPNGYSSSWAQYTIQLPLDIDRAAVQEGLKAQGIPTMVYYPKPMHMQEAFRGKCLVPIDCSVTERLCDSVLSLPMGPYMKQEDVNRVVSCLIDVAK